MPRPAFWIGSGWLRYFNTYALPELVKLEEPEAKFVRDSDENSDGEIAKTVPLYRLQWPGEGDTERDNIPHGIADNWPEAEEYRVDVDARPVQNLPRQYPIKELLEWDAIPERCPETIAYHLAVNRETYGPLKYDVCGLPAARVEQVLDGVFALDPNYHATITYLRQMAETHRGHPFFIHFDTGVRDELHELPSTAVWLFFYMLGDCQYDREAKWWDRNETRRWWARFATYLHWVGRSGTGTYRRKSRLPREEEYGYKRFVEEVPDVVETLDRWDKPASTWQRDVRGNAHDDGWDPCHSRPGEDNTGPSLG